MGNNKEITIKWAFWATWIAVVAGCGFFIVYNAHWLIGDDAIVIRHTGSGNPFLPSGTVSPSGGRFYPFAYLVYDILLLFGRGTYMSAQAHYVIQLIAFVVFVFCMTKVALFVLKDVRSEYRFVITLLFAITCIGRTIPNYLECFSTAWNSYTMVGVILFSVILFFEKQKWFYGCIALLLMNYLCYCGETGFVLPLSMGTCALLFQRKTMTRNHKIFCWLLVGSAALFLVLYAILILPYIQSAYDSSHGSNDSIIMNAVKMTYAQKILLLAFVLLVVRVVDILKNKSEYTLYDNLLLTAAACCCGNFVLRLNWTLYYNVSALLVLPAILFFSVHYLKEKWTAALFVLLALFYGSKIPSSIIRNQNNRINTYEAVSSLVNEMENAEAVFWYEPNAEAGGYDDVLREWKHVSLSTYLGWMLHNPGYVIPLAEEFSEVHNTIWLLPKENEKLFPNNNIVQTKGKLFFESGGIEGYLVNK